MSILKKFRHKAKAVRGAAMKGTGRLTGSRRLRAKGRGRQAAGNVELAADKVSDATRH